jgi:hypothetical protein
MRRLDDLVALEASVAVPQIIRHQKDDIGLLVVRFRNRGHFGQNRYSESDTGNSDREYSCHRAGLTCENA